MVLIDLEKTRGKGVYRGGSNPPPLESELSHFSNLKLKSEDHKKNSLLFIQCIKKIVLVNQNHHDRSPNEKSV